jgi:aldehyde dehydrogenase (NAD+)/phenylacetaldehyde dehydrogenase
VLISEPFDELEQAIALANDSRYGLAAHLWTSNLNAAHYAASRLQAGTVFVNCALLADPAFPFGGMKHSGLGRENGPEALDAYLEPKTVVMALS